MGHPQIAGEELPTPALLEILAAKMSTDHPNQMTQVNPGRDDRRVKCDPWSRPRSKKSLKAPDKPGVLVGIMVDGRSYAFIGPLIFGWPH